jgi:hypothetical protein
MKDQSVISDEMFHFIHRRVTLPSLFMKPSSKDPEHELRFAFKTPKDQKTPKDIHNRGLLDYIEVIER